MLQAVLSLSNRFNLEERALLAMSLALRHGFLLLHFHGLDLAYLNSLQPVLDLPPAPKRIRQKAVNVGHVELDRVYHPALVSCAAMTCRAHYIVPQGTGRTPRE